MESVVLAMRAGPSTRAPADAGVDVTAPTRHCRYDENCG
jgi:hypothetical protein